MRTSIWLTISTLSLLLGPLGGAFANGEKDARMAWWREARFGMFIHWGLYSIPAGEWNGQTGHAEWIRTTAQIPIGAYDQLVAQFNPVKFDANAWVQMAKDAGMKYIVITSKHHDGFCLFDSARTDFDVMSTPFRRDILKELSEACHRQGVRMCFYHSIMDWHHPDYLPRRDWEVANRPAGDAQFDRYVAHLHDQVTELLTKYGDIGVLWFDGEWEGTWGHKYGKPLYELCRKLQPNIIVNDRVDKGRNELGGAIRDEFSGDFGTPEQQIPPTGVPGADWETCMTMNDHWGFNLHDKHFKSTQELVRNLVDIASKGGNFLLNVGPKADGSFPQESIDRLREIGQWMRVNGDAIYGTKASPFPEQLPWGRCTTKADGDNTVLFLHVFDWPKDGALLVPGLGNDVRAAHLLAGADVELDVKRDESDVRIRLPAKAPDDICSVVALDVVGKPVVYATPEIVALADILIDELRVELKTPGDALEVHYSIDGAAPTKASPKYDGPITIHDSTVVMARAFHKGRAVSAVVERRFTKVAPRPAAKVERAKPGLTCECYNGDWSKLPDFAKLTPSETRVVPDIGLHAVDGAERFGRRLTGFIEMPADAVYVFALTADDGARLLIDGEAAVDNDGLHTAATKTGAIPLAAGFHALTVEYFNKTGQSELDVKVARLGAPPAPIAAERLRHAE